MKLLKSFSSIIFLVFVAVLILQQRSNAETEEQINEICANTVITETKSVCAGFHGLIEIIEYEAANSSGDGYLAPHIRADFEGFEKTITEYWASQAKKHKLSAKVYENQQALGFRLEVITFVVVISALLFTASQMYMSFRLGNIDLQTEFEADAKSFKLRTQVVGLVVLVISIVFIYLFYSFVYSIQKPPADNERPKVILERQEVGG